MSESSGQNPEAMMIESEKAAISLAELLEDLNRLKVVIGGLGKEFHRLRVFLLRVMNTTGVRRKMIEMLRQEGLSTEILDILNGTGEERGVEFTENPDLPNNVLPFKKPERE